MTDADYMALALAEARRAEALGEVPVGAIVVYRTEVIARAHNCSIFDHDPTAHAEILALRAAGHALGNYRLNDCDLYCIIEPCAMCAGAMVHARIRRLVYGAADPKAGAAGSLLDVTRERRLNHQVEVISAVMQGECSALLQDFFRRRRKSDAAAPR
jgi:tRNA(adenine34) deaminase